MNWQLMRRVSYLMLLVAIMYGAKPLIATSLESTQEISNEASVKEKSFIELQNSRDRLIEGIQTIGKEIEEFNSQIWNINELHRLENALKESKSSETRAQLRKDIERAKENAGSGTVADIERKIKEKQLNLELLKKQRAQIESEMSRRVDIEQKKQDFKSNISLYFAFVIALIIVGFFFIAYIDETVRREIFRGQAGIQFITLFSVVIAIILFGITNILEAKELAALLGGLSGYILGRVATQSTSSVQAKTPISLPTITGISPTDVTAGATPTTIPVQIVGNGLQLANSVKIVQGANEVMVSDITSNDLVVNCKVTLNATQAKGKYDVIVTNTDGAVAKLPQAFTIK